MSERLNVIFLPHPVKPSMFNPWGEDVVRLVGANHNVTILDYDQPLAPQFKGIDAVIDHGGSAGTREMVDAATDARLWQILGTGFDHFDLEYWKTKGIPTANCPGQFSAVALAECAMMFILMLTRQYNDARATLDSGELYEPMGLELIGVKLGLIGFGASAIELARRAKPFGMDIMAIDIREVSAAEREEFGLSFVGTPDDLEKVVAESDILSLHLHLNSETHHIIDARMLSLMKPTAHIINVARGALIDEEALTQALLDGKIGGAGIDAYSQEPPDITSPFFSLPNVIATPHTAGVTDGTSRKRAQCASDNVDRVAAGLEPLYRIDLD